MTKMIYRIPGLYTKKQFTLANHNWRGVGWWLSGALIIGHAPWICVPLGIGALRVGYNHWKWHDLHTDSFPEFKTHCLRQDWIYSDYVKQRKLTWSRFLHVKTYFRN